MTGDTRRRPIGVFDSGVGGLTVFRALRQQLPGEDLLYLGDTARVPYGTKSAESVKRYANAAAQLLIDRGVKLLVVACNTASALALDALETRLPELPIVGVIKPGAAAAAASLSRSIAVIGTEGTIRSEVYVRAIHALRPEAQVVGVACSLFVALAEEGWIEGPVVRAVAQEYLHPIFNEAQSRRPGCLVLGCTHFPVLTPVIAEVAGPGVTVIDSAQTTAISVKDMLQQRQLQWDEKDRRGSDHFMATDGLERFRRVGRVFLGAEIAEEQLELVDL